MYHGIFVVWRANPFEFFPIKRSKCIVILGLSNFGRAGVEDDQGKIPIFSSEYVAITVPYHSM